MKKIIILIFIFCTNYLYSQTYQWQPLGKGAVCSSIFVQNAGGCFVSCMTVDTIKNILYVSGAFDTLGGQYCFGGFWDGNNWYTLSSDLGGNDMLMLKGNLINIGNEQVAQWDGIKNRFLGNVNYGDKLECLAVYNNDLIVGGEFNKIEWNDTSGKTHSITANSIARWHDTAWYPLGEGLTGIASPKVKTMEVYNGELYAGGNFDQSGSLPLHNIARWDGTQWKQAGGVGTNLSSGNFYGASVSTLNRIKNDLYAYGSFDSIGGIYASYFAKWNDTIWKRANWNPIGAFLIPFNNSIFYSIGNSVFQTDGVFTFTKHGTISGVQNGYIHAICEYDGQIFIGGNFTFVDNVEAHNIARLVDITAVTKPEKQKSPELYPNPVTDELTISGFMFQPGDKITVTDLLGRVMEQKTVTYSTSKFQVPTSHIPSGIYFLHLSNQCAKFVKQ